MRKVLVVDDDVELGSYVKEYLEAKSLDVHVCSSASFALEYLKTNKPNLCILDVMMPIMDGFTLAEKIVADHEDMPFLFLTGQGSKHERIRGLKLGADDYVLKPFSLEELYLRIQNVLKRIPADQAVSEQNHIKIGQLEFDKSYQKISGCGHEYKLSDIENRLLLILCKALNQPVQREAILQEIWGESDEYKSKSLNVYITRLRKILAADPSIELINLHGKGYKLVTS